MKQVWSAAHEGRWGPPRAWTTLGISPHLGSGPQAGLGDCTAGFSFLEVGPPAKAKEEWGLSQEKKGDRGAPVFTWNTVFKTLAAVMNSPSTLFCCSGDCDCLATTCSVLGSFTGPDTLFLLGKHFHSTLNIYYVNERYIGMYPWLIFIAIPCQYRVYYDWLPMRALCSRIPCLVLPTSIDLWCHFLLF